MHARAPIGAAAGVGAAGRALAAVVDLEALALRPDKLAVAPQVTGSRTAILSASWGRARAAAPALAVGEPT